MALGQQEVDAFERSRALEIPRLEPLHRALEIAAERAGASPAFVTTRFGRMRHFLSGSSSGPSTERPILFLHGIASTGLAMLPLALAVAAQRPGASPDLFDAAGDSRRVTSGFGVRAMTVLEHVESVEALLDSLGWEELDVAGTSFGAWIAVHLAARTRRVRRLLLVSPTGLRADVVRFRELAEEVDRVGFSGAHARLAGRSWLSGLPLVGRTIERLHESALGRPRVRELLLGLREEDAIDDSLGRVTAAVHLVAGTEDTLVRPESHAELLAGLSSSSSATGTWVIGASHNVAVEAPAEVYLALRDLLGLRDAAHDGWGRLRLHLTRSLPTRAMEASAPARGMSPP